MTPPKFAGRLCGFSRMRGRRRWPMPDFQRFIEAEAHMRSKFFSMACC